MIRCLQKVTIFIIFMVFNLKCEEMDENLIYILQWTSRKTEPFNFMNWERNGFVYRGCHYDNCYVTDNVHHFEKITDFHVILFNAVNIRSYIPVTLPEQRAENQLYVFVSTESAANYPGSSDYNGVFNRSWTYRLDSDLPYTYFVVRNNSGDVVGPKELMYWEDQIATETSDYVKWKLRNKSKAAAWFVSNCITTSQRLTFAKILQFELEALGLSLDIYGQCGDFRCPKDGFYDSCLGIVEADYYFYLAFENSFSDDYVSEKLLIALQHFSVPVVYGGANYSRFLPDGSYLDARALGPSILAKEIQLAIDNREIYYQYFKWHEHYSYHSTADDVNTDPICAFCAFLNKKRNERNVLGDFEKWWNKPTDNPEVFENYKYERFYNRAVAFNREHYTF